MCQFVDTVSCFGGKHIRLKVLRYMMPFDWTFQRSFLLPSTWLSTRRTGNYKLSRRRIPEDFNLHQQRCGNIQSRTWSTAPFGIHIKTGKSHIKNISRKSFAADFKHKLQLKSVERIKMGTDSRHFLPMSTFEALCEKNESKEYLY